MKNCLLLLLFILPYGIRLQAQTGDPFEALQRQMEQMINDMRSGRAFSMPNMSPGRDSTFFFRMDTTLENGSNSFFFRFFPQDGNVTPDDGSIRNDDDLLPEEKLRQQDTLQAPVHEMPPMDQTKPAPAKRQKIKTVRI